MLDPSPEKSEHPRLAISASSGTQPSITGLHEIGDGSSEIARSQLASAAPVNWNVRSDRTLEFTVDEVRNLFAPGNPVLRDRMTPMNGNELRIVVVDDVFLSLHGTGLQRYLQTLPGKVVLETIAGGEGAKRADQAWALLDLLQRVGLGRWDAPVVAIGGGACLDVVGFAASIYRRGVSYIRIPTTLMAQIDAGIGVKTAINWRDGKNRIGTFAPPAHVLVDYDLLATLPARHVSNGIAEIIKLAICAAPDLFIALESHIEALQSPAWNNSDAVTILRWSVAAMLDQLRPNLFERDPTRLVDFGHWLSPHLELHHNDLLHGEAVAVDIAVSCVVASSRNLLKSSDLARILRLLERARLPNHTMGCTTERIALALHETARHRGGRQRIPLPIRPGECIFVDDLTVEEVADACHKLSQEMLPIAFSKARAAK